MKHLTKIIKAKGFKINEFAKLSVNKSYRAFKTQIDEGTMQYKDIKKVLRLLNIKFEDIDKYKATILKSPKVVNKKITPKKLRSVETEEEWAKLYIGKIKEPYAEKLLCSILFEEKKVTLKEFCKTYHISTL